MLWLPSYNWRTSLLPDGMACAFDLTYSHCWDWRGLYADSPGTLLRASGWSAPGNGIIHGLGTTDLFILLFHLLCLLLLTPSRR